MESERGERGRREGEKNCREGGFEKKQPQVLESCALNWTAGSETHEKEPPNGGREKETRGKKQKPVQLGISKGGDGEKTGTPGKSNRLMDSRQEQGGGGKEARAERHTRSNEKK